jgi:hypothetical protein
MGLKKLKSKIRFWLEKFFHKKANGSGVGNIVDLVPSWKDCKHASCWDGSNAQKRMMNMLSPHFSDAKFDQYLKWMKSRGCDTAHLFFGNERDGEGAGYYATDNVRLSKKRIQKLREEGFAIVAWLMADDSPTFSKAMFAKPDEYVKHFKEQGLFDHVSFVVLGLEMNEYGSEAQWQSVRKAVQRYLPGMKIGVHHTSGKYPFIALGDIVCDQLDPKNATTNTIYNSVKRLRALGREVIGFEYARQPNRDLANAALRAGAFGVGNW